MSRSALWRQESQAKERERQALDLFQQAIEDGKNNRTKNLVPLWGNLNTFNLNPVLLQNIGKAPYFVKKCLTELHDWNSVVDEIYYEVKHLEPWNGVSAKSPSTAFCLLVRLLTLRITEKQLHLTLTHVDSPYIRGIGFLYLRFAGDPNHLWGHFAPYLFDPEPIQVTMGPTTTTSSTTLGDFVRCLLTDREYYGTILPRLPHALEEEIQVKLLQVEKLEKRAARHYNHTSTMDYFMTIGSKVQAMYEDEDHPVAWYPAVIDRVITIDDSTGIKLPRPKFVVTFTEYGNTETVSLGELDMPGSNNINARGGSHTGHMKGSHRTSHDYQYDGRPHHHDSRQRDDDEVHDRVSSSFASRRGYDEISRNSKQTYDGWHGSKSSGGGGGVHNDSRRKNDDDDLYEQVRRRERDKAACRHKGDYVARPPPSTKESLATATTHGRKRPFSNDLSTQNASSTPIPTKRSATEPRAPASTVAHVPVRKSNEELAAIEEKKRKLLAKYG